MPVSNQGAGVTVVVGGLGDAGAVRRGEIDGRDFAERRAVDAAEGATNAVVGIAAASAGGMAVTAALGTYAGTAVATSLGTAGTVGVTAISSMGALGASAGAVLGGVTVAGAAPVLIGGARWQLGAASSSARATRSCAGGLPIVKIRGGRQRPRHGPGERRGLTRT
jgi:hypothetical protein